MTTPIEVAYRDAHLLVLVKPSGLPTTSPTGTDCLAALAKEIDPTAQRLHPTSRLDADVTGLVTFARTERATRTLLAARQEGNYARRYLAIVTPPPTPSAGTVSASIAIDPQNPRRRVPQAETERGGRTARSSYRTLAVVGDFALLCLTPMTGRTHQLRVHAAHIGAPIFGDRHYGGPTRLTTQDGRVWSARRVMLHCAALRIPHPRSGTPLTLRAPVPSDMRDLWLGLGGAAQDFPEGDEIFDA